MPSAPVRDVSPDAWRKVHGTFPAVAAVRAMQAVVSAPAGDAVSATPKGGGDDPEPEDHA